MTTTAIFKPASAPPGVSGVGFSPLNGRTKPLYLIYTHSSGKAQVNIPLTPGQQQSVVCAFNALANAIGVDPDEVTFELERLIALGDGDGKAIRQLHSQQPEVIQLLKEMKTIIPNTVFAREFVEGERTDKAAPLGLEKSKSRALKNLRHRVISLLTKAQTEVGQTPEEIDRRRNNSRSSSSIIMALDEALKAQEMTLSKDIKANPAPPSDIKQRLAAQLKQIQQARASFQKLDNFAIYFSGMYQNLSVEERIKKAHEWIDVQKGELNFVEKYARLAKTKETHKQEEDKYAKDLAVAHLREGHIYHDACKEYEITETALSDEHYLMDAAILLCDVNERLSQDPTADIEATKDQLKQVLRKMPLITESFGVRDADRERFLGDLIDDAIQRAKTPPPAVASQGPAPVQAQEESEEEFELSAENLKRCLPNMTVDLSNSETQNLITGLSEDLTAQKYFNELLGKIEATEDKIQKEKFIKEKESLIAYEISSVEQDLNRDMSVYLDGKLIELYPGPALLQEQKVQWCKEKAQELSEALGNKFDERTRYKILRCCHQGMMMYATGLFPAKLRGKGWASSFMHKEMGRLTIRITTKDEENSQTNVLKIEASVKLGFFYLKAEECQNPKIEVSFTSKTTIDFTKQTVEISGFETLADHVPDPTASP